ncbi:MAG: hypothetical protein LIO91_03730 [Bacteroidales bacterium]|nr:hypothetical protein [Bacteroidales bacterium]
MNKKLLTLLQTKCKDFGLSKNAIEDLAKSGSEGITDDTSDEDIEKKADSLVPFAKLMQAEVTRKAQKQEPPKSSSKPQSEDPAIEGSKNDDSEPSWFKAYKAEQEKQLAALRKENDEFKAAKAKQDRGALISSKAKELGIPEVMMKHFHIEDDANIEKTLTEYKQELVTSRLMPADITGFKSSSKEAAKDDSLTWAKTLPDK